MISSLFSLFIHKRARNGRFSSIKSSVRRFVNHMKWFFKMLTFVTVSAVIVSIVVAAFFFQDYGQSVAFYEKAQAKEIQPVEKVYTVLDAIADCESGIRKADGSAVKWSARQFDKNGQLVMYVNMKGSYAGTTDIGYMGINQQIHGKQAGKLGYNVSLEDGNKAFGKWLYDHEGTKPWNSSKSCWSKAHYKEI